MNNLILLGQFTIPNYVRQFTSSNSIRPTYYERHHKIPVSYCNSVIYKADKTRVIDESKYSWKPFPVIRDYKKTTVDYLIDNLTGERVISNQNRVGKANIKNINGQSLYNGTIKEHERNKLMGTIKDQLRSCVMRSDWGKSLEIVLKSTQIRKKGKTDQIVDIYTATKPITKYPLIIKAKVYDQLIDEEFCNNQEWDVDNRIVPYNKAFQDILTDMSIIKDDNSKYVLGPPHVEFYPLYPGQQRKIIYAIFLVRDPYITNHPQMKEIHKDALL